MSEHTTVSYQSAQDLKNVANTLNGLGIEQKALVVCQCFWNGLMTADVGLDAVRAEMKKVPLDVQAKEFALRKPEVVNGAINMLVEHLVNGHFPGDTTAAGGFTQKELDCLTSFLPLNQTSSLTEVVDNSRTI